MGKMLICPNELFFVAVPRVATSSCSSCNTFSPQLDPLKMLDLDGFVCLFFFTCKKSVSISFFFFFFLLLQGLIFSRHSEKVLPRWRTKAERTYQAYQNPLRKHICHNNTSFEYVMKCIRQVNEIHPRLSAQTLIFHSAWNMTLLIAVWALIFLPSIHFFFLFFFCNRTPNYLPNLESDVEDLIKSETMGGTQSGNPANVHNLIWLWICLVK